MALIFPPLYLLKSHLEHNPTELHRLEDEIHPVWNLKEATFVLGAVNSRIRAAHDLRKLGVETKDVMKKDLADAGQPESQHSSKRRKTDSVGGKEVITLDSETESESEVDKHVRGKQPIRVDEPSPAGETVKVLKLAWFKDSVKAGKLLPPEDYLVYEGAVITKTTSSVPKSTTLPASATFRHKSNTSSSSQSRQASRKFGSPQSQRSSRPVHLLHQTTSEHEGTSDMPPIPEYLHTKFCCQRPTLLHCPNDDFLSQLRIIKKARVLKGNDVSTRAYSGAVATIASYPYSLTLSRELSRLPNVGPKITELWHEWTSNGTIKEVEDIQSDPEMLALDLFFDIHGVGSDTAQKFYNYGWRDLDDIIRQGWERLTDQQKIGVKYYDEFLQRIGRDEVERTAEVILDHANQIRSGFQMVICGGYRRGKQDSGDVDVVLSHPDEEATAGFLPGLLASLEDEEYIKNRLVTSTRNSDRGQETLSWRGSMHRSGGGFDTLDHAFVVWQDPEWPSKEEDLEQDPRAKNPNPHRRVDIIISPWKTAGCAVIGWSGGTMFERDLRKYCKDELGFKFDSSGVRSQAGGDWINLEEGDGDLLIKEKRVFSGLKLEWLPPTSRCTD